MAESEFDENFDTEQLADHLKSLVSEDTLEILSNKKIDGKKFTKLTKDALQKLSISEDDLETLLDTISQITRADVGGALQDYHADFTELFCDISKEELYSDYLKLSKKQLPETHISVVMHTLLPAFLWGWTGQGCSLFVYFEAKELGNWKDGHELHQTGYVTVGGYIYFTASVAVPITVILKCDSKLVYRYAVVTNGENQKFEKIFLCGKRDNRLFHIPESELIPQNTVRCYDIPVFPDVPADNFDEVQLFLLRTYSNLLLKFNASRLLPTKEDDNYIRNATLNCHLLQTKKALTSCSCNHLSSSLISELINTITSVYTQVSDIYFQVNSRALHFSSPEKHYPVSSKNYMKDKMVQWITKVATYHTEEIKSVNTHNCSIITGVIFVLVIHQLKLTERMSIDDLSCVVRLLRLISLPNKDENCNRFLVMKSCLSTSMENQLSLALQALCLTALNKSQGNSEDWVYPIPLYHFLFKPPKGSTSSTISAPFRPLPIKVNNINWLFWPEIFNWKKNFQRYISKQYNSYEIFWDNMMDWMKLDPVLMKLLIYLCPEDKLVSILPKSPLIVAISFLIFILNMDKSEMKKYSCIIQESFTVLQGSIVNAEDACKTIVNEVLIASKEFVQVFIDKFIDFHKYHKEMIQKMLEYYSFIILNLCDQDNVDENLDVVRENVEKWMLAVIGSRSIGGTSGKKLAEELQIWEMLFQSFAFFQNEIWETKVKVLLENRAEQVNPNQKLQLFQKANLSKNCNPFIIEVFVKMGVNGLSFLPGKEANKAITNLLKKSDDFLFIDQLISCFIFNQFGDSENYKIIIDDLISRDIWPSLIRIAKNQSVCKRLSEHARKILNNAKYAVTNISLDIKNGNICFSELEKLVLNESKIQDVLDAADVEPKNIGIFKHVLNEVHKFITSVNLLFSNIGTEAIKGYKDIADDLRVQAESMSMNQLCIDWQGQRSKFVRGPHLSLDSPLHPIIIPFGIMEQSKLFHKIWCKSGENCFGLTQEKFVKEVWYRCIDECKKLVDTCCDETAVVSDLESLFLTFNLDELSLQLKSLVKALKESNFYSQKRNDKWIERVCLKIEYYRFSQQCEKFSTFLLLLKEQLKLVGSCYLLQSFANQNTLSYQLKDINDEFFKTSDLIKNDLCDENVNCLQCLVEDSWDIVEWIGKSFKDLSELQNFVDVAITTDTDELNTLKLNSLRFIGNSFANFIPILRNELTSSDDSASDMDKSSYMIEICSGLWIILKQNHDLPSLLKECNANLELYKSIKNSQGDVQLTTLQELDEIMNSGSFLIGTQNTAPYFEFQISNVLSLTVKDSEISYDLEKIQDLESRLVLIAGQSLDNNENINGFLSVFHVAQVLADVLVKLQEQGCVKYIGWQCCFYLGETEISQLEDEQKSMSRDLKLWEKTVDAARNDFYVLNSFTSKQLMQLRSDLVPHFVDGHVQFNINYQTYSLLKYLCPCADENLMISELKNSWHCMDDDFENVQRTADDNNTSKSEDCDNEDKVIIEDVNVIVDKYLTEEQRSAFVELTEARGLSDVSLWVISEILMSDSDTLNTNDILLKIADLQEEENEPSQEELVLNVLNTLKISNNCNPSTNNALTSNASTNSLTNSSTNSEKSITSAEVNIESLDIYTKDFLSLQMLMKFLTLYANNVKKHVKEIKRHRRLAEMEFFPGSPNLYVTSETNVLKTTLMFYAADIVLPLPTQEEILICNEKTTAEEVILLWRRALLDPEHNRVFCLVHGEKLSYATCEESLQELNRLKQGKDGYRLAIICSNEHSGKPHFITALHSYRRTDLKVNNDLLQTYLENHLISPQYFNISTSNFNSKTAAFLVDPQKSYVRVVYSHLSGNGKSLYVQRLGEKLAKEFSIKEPVLHIPIHGPSINLNRILTKLCDLTCTSNSKIIHIDIPTMMIEAVETFLFSFLILGNLHDHLGITWRREISHMYIIEITYPTTSENSATFHLLDIFPSVACVQPNNTLKHLNYNLVAGMDKSNLLSEEYQRVYQYLCRYNKKDNLDNYKYQHSSKKIMDDENKFIEIISKHANIKTWSDVHHYVKFLNVQLLACENSTYCNMGIREWSGFKNFVIKMMIQMSKEFTTSSITEDTAASDKLKQYELNRLWNNGFHPYVFFNKDNITFTFMGFSIDNNCNAVHPISKKVVMQNVLSKDLMDLLKHHGVDLSDNYLTWKKEFLLEKLGLIIGLEYQYCDPDPSYVITGDNVLKMMAILMRFRCGIPVVMMGETGCGKTRLLRYLCNLGAMDDIYNKSTSNMIILKVHGGTSHEDIEKAVNKAEERCMVDNSVNQSGIGTVLFFDEANTTDHINLIKEIMCDHTIFGKPLHKNLRIAAACNPYRKHSEEMIKKLESAGLGFYTKAAQTKEKLGSIPLRHLVYRVHDLPSSMASLVFDFGELSNDTEFKYIEKIVENKITHSNVREICSLKAKKQSLIDAVSKVLSSSQEFMKLRQNECGFVSLRDIDRALIIFFFFIELLRDINDDINKKAKFLKLEIQQNMTCFTRALLLTLGVCYHTRIEGRADFEQSLIGVLERPLTPLKNSAVFVNVLQCCQEVILDNMKLGENIARNSALRENVFMMFVCVSLRIPLFLVGKPGSSKSLAKSIIMNSMKGANSESKLLRNLKEVQLFSYQCSQLSTSDTIIKVFSQANSVQNQWDKSKYVAVVILDEIGLAEDSPNLPLKTLHPLLEDGTDGNNFTVDFVNRDERVAFIGISNWALDPAKMNRGVMVVRGCLSLEELQKTALQICTGEGIDETFIRPLKTFFNLFAEAYLQVLESQTSEFYGLRDFYSLIKMLFWMCKSVDQQPNSVQIEHVIKRNFSGKNDIDMLKLFKQKLPECSSIPDKESCREKCEALQRKLFKKEKRDYLQKLLFNSFKEEHNEKHLSDFQCMCTRISFEEYQKRQFYHCCKNGDFKCSKINQEFEKEFHEYFNEKFENEIWPFIINPDNSSRGLIISSLINKERTVHGESRYLLFLTENYAALHTLKHFLESPVLMKSSNNFHKPYIIFGSSFPKDKDFTQVYRNINNIKVCMETGRVVVLLNLESLYEGLYDVLNQYYVYFNKMRFVDMGLQNHRVKCRVHDDFKLILIAEKDKVYNEFPAALINRLEKHFVVVSSILDQCQLKIEERFQKFIHDFCSEKFEPFDSFIGYQNDTPAAVVLKASELKRDCDDEQFMRQCKFLLLQIASPDALIRLRKNDKINTDQFDEIVQIYTKEQHHSSLKDFLLYQMEESENCRMQVTTCNDLLSYEEINSLIEELAFDGNVITYILQEFDTEFEFSRKVRESIQCNQSEPSLIIIQCDSGHLNSDLIACAKYRIDDIWESRTNSFPCYVLFTVLIPREHNKSSFVSFLGGDWICVHIDDLYPDNNYSPLSLAFSETPLSKIFYDDENVELNITIKSSEQISFNHCQFLYKNIAAILNSPNPDSKFALRCHELNDILYRQLMVLPPINCEFYKIVVIFIHKQLKSYEMKNKDWIFNAASNIEDLQKGGAFVNVLLRNIDTIVNRVFSKIIAFADKNYNLSLIDQKNDNTSPESRFFWMKAFSYLLELNVFEENQQDIYDFHCQFPFSYYLHHAVESSLSNIQEEVVTDQVQSKVQLLDTISVADFMDMTTRYINDSVQLKWPVTYKDELINAKELQIISRSVYARSSKTHEKFSEIAREIHKMLAELESEITCFKDLIALFPTILDKLEFDENLPLHLLAALCALDVMDDDHKSLKNNANPRTIINKLHRFYQAASSIDSALSYSDHEVCEKFQLYRLKWQGIQVMHLFIEHVMLNHGPYINKTIPFMTRLRVFVEESCDFSKKATLRKLELLLSQMYREFVRLHNNVADNFAQSCTRFYIAVVSSICMRNGTPDDDLVDKLLETVFNVSEVDEQGQTRDLTPFIKSKNYDSVPVLRSYLLQLILQQNKEDTKKHIQKYFDKVEKIVSTSSSSSKVITQIKLLYCQLYENSLHNTLLSESGIPAYSELLEKSQIYLMNNIELNLSYLEAVASVRYVLQNACRLIVTNKIDKDEDHIHFLAAIKNSCCSSKINSDHTGPHIFLLKILFRRLGESGLRRIIQNQRLKWILPERLMNNEESKMLDYFAIYQEKYTSVRKVVISALAKESDSDTLNFLESNADCLHVHSMFFVLSIFMEITSSFKNIEDFNKITQNKVQIFRKFIVGSTCKLSNELQEISVVLLDNNFCASNAGKRIESLYIQPNHNPEDQIYASVVVHIATVIFGRKDLAIINFFCTIMSNPVKMKNAYWPSMPEDFEDDARRIIGGQAYECPNGHPYFVTECGRPMEEKYCVECKKQGKKVIIGGKFHKPKEGNKQRNKKHQTGYILGPAVESQAFPERTLSPASCTILKLFIHSALLWGCCACSNEEDINKTVEYDIPDDQLPLFFWKHLMVNFKSLQDLLSMSVDDTALLIHLITSNILTQPLNTIEPVYKLTTCEDKYKWERQFDQRYIHPILKKLQAGCLETSRKLLLEDKRSNHPLLVDYVYERNITDPDINAHLWKYQPAITLEHLIQQLEVGGLSKTYPVLSFFLREETSLRATKYLPAIFHLQSYLHGIYHYRSSCKELQELSISGFLHKLTDDDMKKSIEEMIDQVNQAWKLVRGKLQARGHHVLQNCIMGLSGDTPIIHLVPRQDCCTTTLMNYLVEIHNDFMTKSLKLIQEMHSTGRTWKSIRKDLTIKLKNLHKSHLLDYDANLMPTILAHCHYSVTVGQDKAELEYDFEALEKQILNDFVYGKPKIEYSPVFVEYRKDVYTGMKVHLIKEKIKPQISLSEEAKKELLKKLNRIQQLEEALNHIDIVMGFLASGGQEDGNMSLLEYGVKILKIKDFNKTVGEGHCLGQVYSLWSAISVTLSKKVTLTGKLAFTVSKCFCEPMNMLMDSELDKSLENIDLDCVLYVLNEFIEVHVSNAAENQAKWTIGECLGGYLGELKLPKNLRFLCDIPMCNMIKVWEKIVDYQNKHEAEIKQI